MIHHVYIGGRTAIEVDGTRAARSASFGEWYICTEEHLVDFDFPKEDGVVVYHQSNKYLRGMEMWCEQ